MVRQNIKIVAAGSNDSGVSWIVEVAGKRIFHAGDLNNWYAKFLTSDYKGGTIRSFEFGEIDPQKTRSNIWVNSRTSEND